jgi:hypothetical protein
MELETKIKIFLNSLILRMRRNIQIGGIIGNQLDLNEIERMIVDEIPRVERIHDNDYDFGYIRDTIITDSEFRELVENDSENMEDLKKYVFIFRDRHDILDPERIMDFIVNPYTQKIYNIIGDDLIVEELLNYSVHAIIDVIRNRLDDFDD